MEKSEVIRLRITPELKKAVEERAKQQNRTVSGYLYNLIMEEMKKDGGSIKRNT